MSNSYQLQPQQQLKQKLFKYPFNSYAGGQVNKHSIKLLGKQFHIYKYEINISQSIYHRVNNNQIESYKPHLLNYFNF